MNKKFFYNLSIIAVALALVLGFGAINNTKASDNYNEAFPGQANLFGVDEAQTGVGVNIADRDKAPQLVLETYGLQGDWSDAR